MSVNRPLIKDRVGLVLPQSDVKDEYAREHTGDPKIAIIVPRGEVIRNFAHTGVFDQIGERIPLTLLSVLTDGDLFGTGSVDEIFPLNENREDWIVRIQRDLLDMAHGRWLWSRAAQRRWHMRDNEAQTLGQKARHLTKKALSMPFSNRLGLKLLSKSERSSSSMFNSSNEYIDLFKRVKPTLVFNGSHIHSRNAIQAVQAAQWLGVPTATFIFSWDNLTSQGRITLPYDYFLVWNEPLKHELLEMYDWIRPENVFVTGTPQFDFHFRPEFYWSREQYCEQIGADPVRPIVFYATGMPNHMPGEPEIVEGIADMLAQFDLDDRPQLLVRVYPKDRSGRFDELKAKRHDILFPRVEWEDAWLTPKFEDSYALVNTLKHCALGINVASTLSLELCMFDKPVINVGYNPCSVDRSILSYADYYEFDHYKPVIESGAVSVAWNENEMHDYISAALERPLAARSERKLLIERMFGSTLDGRSSDRVAQLLLELSATGRNSL